MVKDKRADIIFYYNGNKIPLEVKLDKNKSLWTACKHQLDYLYTRDPKAEGYGIFLAFWFGREREMPKPPNGISRPQTAHKLENELNSLIEEESKHRLAAVVIDVSPPLG